MEKILRVVPIIDTEGPTTGRADMVDSWESLQETVATLTGPLRAELTDSLSGGIIINWFLLDWAGYSKNDAEFKKRGHDTKLHVVRDFYLKHSLSAAEVKRTGDGLYWHYHHPPKDGSWGWNADWNDSRWYEYALGKLILDHNYFPSVYRAGKYVENNQNSHWLEKWIPFDYSNISPVKRDFCDWNEAPSDWIPYHPSIENYQHKGDMHRLIARSLPVAAKGGSGALDRIEVEKAFTEVKEGKQAIFSFHTHDYYKSINDEFRDAHRLISQVSKETGIPWQYANALDALRLCLPVSENKGALTLSINQAGNEILITPSHGIFGAMPFIVFEDEVGHVSRIDGAREGSGYTVAIPHGAKRLGVGASDGYGTTAVANVTF